MRIQWRMVKNLLDLSARLCYTGGNLNEARSGGHSVTGTVGRRQDMTKEHTARKHKKRWLILGTILAVIVLACAGFAVYVGSYYHADETALQAIAPADGISVEKTEGDTIVFTPPEPKAGLIFYPGGKVEYTAYAPLMRSCAEKGILCVLLKMPCNLAVLDRNAADGVAEQFPEIGSWYIGGHSLGGAMAASYAAEHSSELDGLVLLAAYATKDLTTSDLAVLSVYGTEDQVMNREKYTECRVNLPSETIEIIIDGGCHAGFGCYGPQDGDGTPAISNVEQITQTAERIADMVLTAGR